MAKEILGSALSNRPSTERSYYPTRATPGAHPVLLGGVMLMLAAGCAQEVSKAPLPVTPPQDRAGAPVIRRTLPETPVPTPPEAAPGVTVPSPEPAIVVPPNAQYVCVTDAAGQRQQTVIEFIPKVATM